MIIKKLEEMKVENEMNNKITYHQEGDYLIPNLTVPNDENENYQIGKYGHLRLSYLKNTNPLEWVGKMNNIKNRAEEIVLKELIYV